MIVEFNIKEMRANVFFCVKLWGDGRGILCPLKICNFGVLLKKKMSSTWLDKTKVSQSENSHGYQLADGSLLCGGGRGGGWERVLGKNC